MMVLVNDKIIQGAKLGYIGLKRGGSDVSLLPSVLLIVVNNNHCEAAFRQSSQEIEARRMGEKQRRDFGELIAVQGPVYNRHEQFALIFLMFLY